MSTAIERVADAVFHARLKHPVFAYRHADALAILIEEVGEVAKALNEGNLEHMALEIAQTSAVCLRWLEEWDTLNSTKRAIPSYPGVNQQPTTRYSTKEAAKFLAEVGTPFTKKTLEAWRFHGKGPRYFKVGGRTFYSKDDLLAFAAGKPMNGEHDEQPQA